MPSDRSRRTDPTRFGYTGVVAQQGRVILDRDVNALQGLIADRIAYETLDVVGPCGTPDDGFRISLPGQSPPPPPLWSPPQPVTISPPDSAGGTGDFFIKPGTMYVGGQRIYFPPTQNGEDITYSYFDQPDWAIPAFPGDPRSELVWLELEETETGAVEDPDLLDVALGGPDTTQRLKLLRRIKRGGVTATSCTDAWKTAVVAWEKQGWQFDPATMRLRPLTDLKVSFTDTGTTTNLCDPTATGGYLGADNQLIRVRTARVDTTNYLVWGWDNASFLYRVTSVSPDGTMLTLASDPPDGYHVPQTSQVVEILTTAAMLEEVPDESDPTHQSEILRAVAEPTGRLCRLSQPYGPLTSGDTTNTIVLTEALPAAYINATLPLFLRVWQTAQEIPANGQVTLSDPATQQNTGVIVTFSEPKGAPLTEDVFWQIAVRPATPQGVYPEELLISPQAPDGPRRWVCPLALINWGTGTVIDCRSVFDNLVTLTKRKPGCCTFPIGPSDVTASATLQFLIDNAAASADTVTVCLSPGTYTLEAPLRLDQNHAGLTLEGCGGTITLQADSSVDASLFADGLIVLTGAEGVTLRGLTLLPCLSPLSTTRTQSLQQAVPTQDGSAATVIPGAYLCFGVRALNSPELTLQGCTITITDTNTSTSPTLDVVAAAVFLQGSCQGLTLTGCTLGSAIAPTYTPYSVATTTSANQPTTPATPAGGGVSVAGAGLASLVASNAVPGLVATEHVVQERAVAMNVTPVATAAVPTAAIPAAAIPPAAIPPVAIPPANAIPGLTAAGASLVGAAGTVAGASVAPPAATLTATQAAPPVSVSATPGAGTASVSATPAATSATPAATTTTTDALLTTNINLTRSIVTSANAAPAAVTRFSAALANYVNLDAPASPPASPPTTTFQLDSMVNDSLELFAAKRSAVNLAAPARVTATVGVLAAGYSNVFDRAAGAEVTAEVDLLCRLGALTIEDNKFQSLTFATAIDATFSAARVQDNVVTTGIAGFWISYTGAVLPPGIPQAANNYYPQVFEEDLAVAIFAAIAQPPVNPIFLQSANSLETTRASAEQAVASPGVSVFITGNQVSSRTNEGNAALYLLLNSSAEAATSPAALASSVVVAQNRLATSSGVVAPAALLMLAQDLPCAITGNIVLNTAPISDTGAAGPSLWLLIGLSEKGANALAVTGNVLRGPTDLGDIPRPGVPTPPDGWYYFNAVQS
jgi:Family of unknown function (DUF6519)